jgi:hypothetical protein
VGKEEQDKWKGSWESKGRLRVDGSPNKGSLPGTSGEPISKSPVREASYEFSGRR